jgi:hypothetical protein
MAAIWGNGGQGGQFPLEQWFYEMPPVTRWWTVATVATSVLVQCHILTPFQLFYSFRAVYFKSQVRHKKPQIRRLLFEQEQRLTLMAVLATSHNISLLRSIKSRSTLPCLFPSAVLATPRRIFRPIPRSFFMAIVLRDDLSPPHFTVSLSSIPRHRPLLQLGVHLEPPQPRHSTQFPRHISLHCAISSLGLDGLQLGCARHCT